MKRLLLITALFCAAVFSSCGKINDELEALDERLDQLELSTIPSINTQITSITTSIGALETTDKELRQYIANLESTAKGLQEQIAETNNVIDELEDVLKDEITTAKAAVLAQLEAVKTELEGELSQINTTIETLKAKDAELDKKIEDLRSYVDEELKNTTDWAEATFATLEQYNELVEEITAIKAQIQATNKSIADLETRLTTKINEDVAAATTSLNAELQQQVTNITKAYTEAVKSAKEEITKAYTTAIQSAISALDSSLKAWVGEQLSNYYAIAEIDAKIEALNKQIEAGDEVLASELSDLKSSLEAAKKELTEAYEEAIEKAIQEYNGEITATIASEINSVNQRIDEEVAAISSKLATLQSQVDMNSADISKLLTRIQSLSYVPQYDDGRAAVMHNGSMSRVTLDFEVSPKDAVAELATVWQEALSVKAVYTKTRAVSFVDMPIVEFEADVENGVISVTASGDNLSAEFFNVTQSASARLAISDGNNSVTSEYIPMVVTALPILDVQFNEDGSATDTGVLNLNIEKVVNADGEAPFISTYVNSQFNLNNIARFGGYPLDMAIQHSYYKVDISNIDMQTAMTDGFTMEVAAMFPINIVGGWSRLVSTESWGIHRQGTGAFNKDAHTLRASFNNPGDRNSLGTQWQLNQAFAPKKYFHIMFVYDPTAPTVSIYVDGQLDSQQTVEGEFNVGNIFAIGAYPYANGSEAYQPWVGDIALVRIYDNILDADAVAKRYSGVKIPAAFVNNTPCPTPLLDLQGADDCTFTNKGSMSSVVPTLVKNEEDKAPNVKVIKLDTYNKPIISFSHTIGVDETASDSYYKITSADSPELFAKLNDGAYTIEAIIGTSEFARRAVPISTEAFNLMYIPVFWRYNVGTFDINREWWWFDSVYRPIGGIYHHIVYVVDAVSGNVAATFVNGYHDATLNRYITSLAEINNFTIGCAVMSETSEIPFCKAFDGNIVMVRVYDKALTALEVDRIYNEDNIKTTLDILNKGCDVAAVKPSPIVDVQFNNDGSATDKVKDYAIVKETIGEGGTLVVSDGVVTFGDSNENMSYYKIDLAQGDGALKTSMNNGFTIEAIVASPNTNSDWAGAFGGEGFSLIRLVARYDNKWNIHGWDTSNAFNYSDGTIVPVANHYYHVLYVYDAVSGNVCVYRDGVYENKRPLSFAMRENSTMLIGSRLDTDGVTVGNSWLGNMAAFRVYEDAVNKSVANLLYRDAKAKLDALNGVAAE